MQLIKKSRLISGCVALFILISTLCNVDVVLAELERETRKENEHAFDLEKAEPIEKNEEEQRRLERETVPEIIGFEEAKSKKHIERMYEEEGSKLNSVIFKNEDGSRTEYIFDYPVKYIDKKGEIKDISLEIADSEEEGIKYETAKGGAIAKFPEELKDGINLEGNDTEISLVPHVPILENDVNMLDVSNTNEEEFVERIDNKTISYEYDDNTTIEYSLTYTGFKEDIVVREYTGQTEYEFTLYTNGLKLKKIEDSYYLVDENSVIKATIGDIIIFTADEKNNTIGTLEAEEIVEKQEYFMTIVLDKDYLADEKTKYPIRIDPTVEINYDNNGSGAIEDVTINSLQGSSGSSGSLMVGLRETYGISRILMKFPGLNISGLGSNVEITNATVEIRDLMCQSTGLTVSCYVFAGNSWSESTANWSNVSPNSISTYLSANTISYANGKNMSTAHRYSFDITKAVQGWKVQNYSQSKGIIFKTTSSVENGSTYNYKTFASYNRSTYKPSLSVTYRTISSGSLANGTYYFNNYYHGSYLKYISSKALASSGYISSLGRSIQWQIVQVNGGYVIRSANDTTKYLGVSSTTTSSAVEIVTVKDISVPTRCIWSISSASGGYYIKSKYNSKYLYTTGSNLYTSATIGTYGTSSYYTRVWRGVLTSKYGATSAYTGREMTTSTRISYYSSKVGMKKTPTIVKGNSNEIWCSPQDFKYSGYSTDIISIDSVTGLITAKKSGTTTVTATHKVTGRSIKFTVYISNLVIYQTEDTYRVDVNGNLPEDLQYGKLSESTLKSFEWLNWSDFIGCSSERCRFEWEFMATTLFSTGEMENVILDMIDHFMSGSGSNYSNSILTKNIYAHSDTQRYISDVKKQMLNLIDTYNGDITKLAYSASNRANNPVVKALGSNGVNQPVYNTASDKINGLTICVDSLWGNKIEISSFKTSGNTYTCTLHYTLYDHFGLDKKDVEKYGYLIGFRSWYILQHYSGFGGKHRPFVTLMEFDVTFTGTY